LPLPPSRPFLTRRTFVALAAPALIVRPAMAATSVSIAGVGGWFQTAFEGVVLAAFRKAHPKISVFYTPVGNDFQNLALLRRQRANSPTDIVLLHTQVAARATSEGLLEPLSPKTMPVLNDLVPQALIPNVAGPALMLDSLTLGYNPTQINKMPQSWRDLWDTGYGSGIALQTPPDPAALAMTAVAGALFGDKNLLHSLELGLVALTQLAPRVVAWDPSPDIYTAIAQVDAQGDDQGKAQAKASIGPAWNARALNQARLTPGHFTSHFPAEGSPVMATTINLVNGAPQPAAARTLIAWLLGADAQRLLTEALAYAPVNAKAKIPTALLQRVGATPDMVAKRIPMDWVVVDQIRDQITREWRRRNLVGH
jgi:putative spermidine/putrescine transport system substrate-binding protein